MCANPSRVIGPPAVQCRRAPTADAAVGETPSRRPAVRAQQILRRARDPGGRPHGIGIRAQRVYYYLQRVARDRTARFD